MKRTPRRSRLRSRPSARRSRQTASCRPSTRPSPALTLFNLARLVGQTGPLDDFPSKRQLLRYAGMNLRERESGTYKGQTRLSKKGRPLLRKVLGQAAFPLLRSDRLLGEPYAERRKRMKQTQAMVAAMRKLLTMVWGAHRSAEAFDPARVHRCQSQYASPALVA